MFRFERSGFFYANVFRLFVRKFREIHSDALEVESRDLFVEVFGQSVNANRILSFVLEEFDLCERLIGKRVRHDERRMPRSTTKIHQSPFGEHDDFIAIRQYDVVNLGLDVLPRIFSHARNVDFRIEVTDVAYDRLVTHANHVVVRDDVLVSRRGYENIGLIANVFHFDDTISFHCGLERANGVNFGNPHR